MIWYLDTSLLVAALTKEAKTGSAQSWLGERSGDDVLVSDWVTAEFSAALSIKLRNDSITRAYRSQSLDGYSRLCAESFVVLPVTRREFQVAAAFADRSDLGLRGGDALHLAVCSGHNATLCTLDRRLSEAGPALGVATLFL